MVRKVRPRQIVKLRQFIVVGLATIAFFATSIRTAQAADAYTAHAVQNNNSFTTSFTGAPSLNGSYLFDVELWNASGQRVFQQYETRTVANTPVIAITKDIPVLANGTYNVRTGLFSPDWSTKFLWDQNAGTVAIGTVFGMNTKVNTTSFQNTFTDSYNFGGNYLFDIELWKSSDQRVYQQFETKSVNNTKTITISKAIPNGLANGTYSVRGGIFSPDWSIKYIWTDTAGTITINNGVVVNATSTTTTPPQSVTTTTAPTTTTTIPAQQSATYAISATTAPTSFDTKFASSLNYNGSYLFDIELWDNTNQRVYQQFETRNVSNTKLVTITKSIPALSAGTYSIRAGIFSPGWSTKYLWTDSAGSITVASTPNNSGGIPSTPTGPTGYNNLAFDDEFNGTVLDTNKWMTCSPQMNYKDGLCYAHDGERQNYLPQNLSMVNFPEGGRGLQISATDTGKTWGNTRPNNVPYGAPMYDSGALSTGPNTQGVAKPGYQPFNFKYGYYESRMKMPKGQGYWPAAWSFPFDNQGPFELDMVEVLGSDTTNADLSYHYPGGQTDEWFKTPDLSSGFHTFGVDWQPDHIAWYFDGKVSRSVFTNTSNIQNKDAYLILNLAVGGNWPGPPNASTPFPGYMNVDYVRVWTK